MSDKKLIGTVIEEAVSVTPEQMDLVKSLGQRIKTCGFINQNQSIDPKPCYLEIGHTGPHEGWCWGSRALWSLKNTYDTTPLKIGDTLESPDGLFVLTIVGITDDKYDWVYETKIIKDGIKVWPYSTPRDVIDYHRRCGWTLLVTK